MGLLYNSNRWAPAVEARCPNQCSGHGRCLADPKDTCECGKKWFKACDHSMDYTGNSGGDNKVCNSELLPAWTGADCSLRVCPQGYPYAASPKADNSHEQLVECSGRGICNRETGLCECFGGFHGQGCRRTKCPNNCNGRGYCQHLKYIADEVKSSNVGFDGETIIPDSPAEYDSSWDSFYLFGCMCDSGFYGPDCSIRTCPSSRDPLGGDDHRHGRECSGRGVCNHKTGECKCFSGYTLDDCSRQDILAYY